MTDEGDNCPHNLRYRGAALAGLTLAGLAAARGPVWAAANASSNRRV